MDVCYYSKEIHDYAVTTYGDDLLKFGVRLVSRRFAESMGEKLPKDVHPHQVLLPEQEIDRQLKDMIENFAARFDHVAEVLFYRQPHYYNYFK